MTNERLELAIFRTGSDEPVEPAFTMTTTGIVIREDLTFEEYKDGLRMWKWMKDNMKVGFSDYLRWGKIKFGDEAVHSELVQLEFEMPTITQAVQISTVPEELRHSNLNSEHYIVLARADIPMAQKEKWAKTASEQNLAPAVLKESIRVGEVVNKEVAKNRQTGIINIDGIVVEFDVWKNRMGGSDGVNKLDRQTRMSICQKLLPIVQFHNAIKPE